LKLVERVTAVTPRYRMLRAENCGADDGLKATVEYTESGQTDKKTSTITVSTLPLHRITVAVGIIYDFAPITDFKGDAVKGESVPVIVQDNHRLGINGIATVSLRPFKVDSARPRTWWQIITPAPTIGISFANALDHIYVGLVFEPYPGVGVIGGYDFHTVATLGGGYKVGDRIPGGQVPIDKRWQLSSEDWFLGLNIDASVLTKILSLVSK
jgi:hypothetical protein